MTTELKSVIDAAMRLSDQDRASLISQLLGTLPDSVAVDSDEFDDAFFDELDRRMAEGLEATVDWASVRDEL